MNKKITFYVGLKKSNGELVEEGKGNKHIQQFCIMLADNFGGCTAWESDGMWIDMEANKFVIEPSLVIEVITPDACNILVEHCINLLKEQIDQTAILYTIQELQEMNII